MKLLTVTVPCYNSQSYMTHCIESLLKGGSEVEIIIVNDGSEDNTALIADAFAAKHPTIVQVIHQKNGGHGAAVMTGLRHARGDYFKVVDSDDWVDEGAYRTILDTLRNQRGKNRPLDLLISNYVYDKVGVQNKHVVQYKAALPIGRTFGWEEVGRFQLGQYILMHATIYRTQLLQNCGLDLPRHTFYVDNLYTYVPMKDVERLYYLDVDFYHYYIGREDQSVNEGIMLARIDQQLRVNKLMLDQVDITTIYPPRKQKCMLDYLAIVTTVSSVLLIKSGTAEDLEKKKALWQYIAAQNPWAYQKLRRGLFGQILSLPKGFGRRVVTTLYRVSQKRIGFN